MNIFLEEFLVYNNGFARKVVTELRKQWLISIMILAVCLGMAVMYALEQPTVYQSELTFVVKMNQPLPKTAAADARLQLVSKIAESDEVKKPISIENNDGKYNSELLGEDYRGSIVRVQNLNTLNMFRVFAHGNTPEEAQRTCIGIYEHIAAFSDKYNRFEIDAESTSGSLVEYANTNYAKAKEAYAEYAGTGYTTKGDTVKNFDEKKEKLYENCVRWEMIYQELLMDELKAKWYNSWQVYLVDEATLPEKSVPKRTGFIIGVGFIIGALLCLLYGTVMSLLNKQLKQQ